MAEPPSATEQALRKLEDQLTCGICLDSYTEPKLLQCFHVFCKQCLERLVVRDRQGLSLHCPSCRRSTLLPPTSVSGLQTAFYLNHLFEVRDALEKVKEPQKTQCEKCKNGVATSFCRNCGQFICATCTTIHSAWEELQSHEVLSLERLKGDVVQLVPPKKMAAYCSKHKGKELELYCNTCGELICHNCTVQLHQGHKHEVVSDTFQKHKEQISASLKPIEQHLEAVGKALQGLDTQCQQITDQREALVGNIHKTIQQLQEALEVRKTELIGQLDQITQWKLKALAAQRDQIELVQIQLSSCLEFVKESLRTGNEGEILAMKKPVVKQVEEITAEFKAEVLVPQERADIRFSASTPELTQTCQQFGKIYSHPVSLERCYATGKGLQVATVGEQATAVLHVIDTDGKECEQSLVNTSCELVSDAGGPTVKPAVQKKKNKYTISYQPTHRGRHQLHIKVEGVPIRGGPFAVIAVKNLSTPIKTIDGLKSPWGVTVNERGEIIVAECGRHCISIFSPTGEKIRTFGSKGFGQGQFREPRGVAVDGDGNMLIVDGDNHRIQKFTADGKSLTAVGQQGKNHLEFSWPCGIAINHRNRKVYICDKSNHRVQILNTDLTFSSSFGSHGSGDGLFNKPWDIALDSTGNVCVADSGNHRIQVFTAEGKFLKKFGKKGSGDGELNSPTGVSIDSDDIVYVTEFSNHRVSMFTSEGQFLRSFGKEGNGPGQFIFPYGIAVDRDGLVYVSDNNNNRIQIF